MKLKLRRLQHQEDGIFSELLDEKARVIARTCEHSYDLKPKLPAGTYTCVRGVHQLAHGTPFETFEITHVPGHSGILFHVGNWHTDSDGCVLVGDQICQSRRGEMVSNSKRAFEHFMDLLKGLKEFTLIVED